MLKLYHGATSVCSQKARMVLVEKDIAWEGVLLDLSRGDQFDPAYRTLNPDGVVPTLVDGDLVVRELSVIAEYVDGLSGTNPLMPKDAAGRVAAKFWLLRTIEIHAAINTMTFATANRERDLASNTPEELEEKIAKLPNPQAAAKRRDLLQNGIASVHVDGALYTLKAALVQMNEALGANKWLAGMEFSLGDIALLPYIDRLERLGMEGLWADDPRVSAWLAAVRARHSYKAAVESYIPAGSVAASRASGLKAWPALESKLTRAHSPAGHKDRNFA